jgi:hypothetical protein
MFAKFFNLTSSFFFNLKMWLQPEPEGSLRWGRDSDCRFRVGPLKNDGSLFLNLNIYCTVTSHLSLRLTDSPDQCVADHLAVSVFSPALATLARKVIGASRRAWARDAFRPCC